MIDMNLKEIQEHGKKFRVYTMMFNIGLTMSLVYFIWLGQWFNSLIMLLCLIWFVALRVGFIVAVNKIIEMKIKYEGLK